MSTGRLQTGDTTTRQFGTKPQAPDPTQTMATETETEIEAIVELVRTATRRHPDWTCVACGEPLKQPQTCLNCGSPQRINE